MASALEEADRLMQAVGAAAVASLEARAAFEDAIRAAHPTWTVRQIAEAAGLSPSRVHQLIQEGETT